MHRTCTICAPAAFAAIAFGATAHADAWDEFEARCLQPFEHLSPVIVDGLDHVKTQWLARSLSPHALQWSLPEQSILFSDPSPKEQIALRAFPDGRATRMCGVTGSDHMPITRDDWVAANLGDNTYGASMRTSSDDIMVMVSSEWIEPKLVVVINRNRAFGFVTYQILETDLES